MASQMVLVVKNLPANAGDIRDTGWIPRFFFYKAVTVNRFLEVCYEGWVIAGGQQEISFQVEFIL